MQGGQRGPGGQQQMKYNVDISKCEDHFCHECGCPVFIQGFVAKKVPALMVGAVRDQIGTLPVLVCKNCMTPAELKERASEVILDGEADEANDKKTIN